ncbi:hypothetical protein LCGC14_2612360 [marine sediment metagenome]|uniref:Uncharacterized protein n=1 Tax=marine sediment metagenome TaxID=412755 RepID=A0A0F9A5H9_9ZZZZ
MQNYDSVNHPDWPYDSHDEPNELESCEYCGAEFEVRDDMLTKVGGLMACDLCASDLIQIIEISGMVVYVKSLLKIN